jgi:hypothetical protein
MMVSMVGAPASSIDVELHDVDVKYDHYCEIFVVQ